MVLLEVTDMDNVLKRRVRAAKESCHGCQESIDCLGELHEAYVQELGLADKLMSILINSYGN